MPQKMPFGFDENDPRCIDFKKRLRDTIESFIWQGYTHFISGGALGMDTYAAETVLELKKEYPEIILEMVSPFDEQAAKWTPEYQRRHDHCLIRPIWSLRLDISTRNHQCLSATGIWSIMRTSC